MKLLFVAVAVSLLLKISCASLCKETNFHSRLFESLNIMIKRNLSISTCDTPEDQGTPFNCVLFPQLPEPTTVHELTPYDIDVVGALGDSITAGYGAAAECFPDFMIQYLGVSWSIGGDEDLSTVTTIPNILRQYNPNLKGYSVGSTICQLNPDNFNVAVGGSIAQNMPAQAEELVARLKLDDNINFDTDWKLVTLWIGGNNLCDYCNNNELHSRARYVQNIKQALDVLHDKLPRTFVNLVQIIDITKLEALDEPRCEITHSCFCNCNNDPETSQMATNYQQGLNDLVSRGRYDTRDDFTVVIQPFFVNAEIPQNGDVPDSSYFAPDCFHLSIKGHTEAAKALWQNMFEPVGNKAQSWDIGGPLYCPTETNPYLCTSLNDCLSPSPPKRNKRGRGQEL